MLCRKKELTSYSYYEMKKKIDQKLAVSKNNKNVFLLIALHDISHAQRMRCHLHNDDPPSNVK